MNEATTRIMLPPPQPPKGGRSRVPRWAWVLVVVLAVAIGAWGGWRAGTGQGEARVGKIVAVSETPGETLKEVDETVSRKVVEARQAVASGDWLAARRLFEEVRDMDPDNADALASLPLIQRRLDEARGTVRVEAVPAAANVRLGDMKEQTTPAIFTGVPFGEHELVVAMEGYDPVKRKILVASEEPLLLTGIELARSSGQIEVVSEPRGAEFKLVRTREREPEELVKVGTTPAMIEQLDPGEYQVFLSVKGFPEQSQTVRVENNRNTSVSAVFASGGIGLTSDPSGAEVWIQPEKDGGKARKAGLTPLSLTDLPVGRHRIELRYEDWPPIRRTVEVAAGSNEDFEFAWERALVSFVSDPPGAEVYLGERRLGRGRETTPFQVELPEGDYRFRARHSKLGEIDETLYVGNDHGDSKSNEVAFRFPFGSVTLESSPPGAAVVSGGMPLGRTPLTLAVVPPGDYTFELNKEAHRSTRVSGKVEPGGALHFDATLTYDPAPVASRNFRNGVGREMVWIPALKGWAGAHEVTQEEYELLGGSNPSYFKAPNHPVDSVTWFEAVKFCESLTAHEQALGTLPPGYRYRLPTDEEWNQLVGNQKLDGAISSLFDRQKSTSPVGSLAPNELGLYDVRGNVWEWVSDWYSQTILNRVQKEGATPNPEWVGTDRKVLRGGAWNRSSQYDLAIANRMAASPASKDRYDVGFRVLLMRD
ncbi:MAG: PEGA domain-containing protein [Verrucomicrobiae bacterium]|nr:PEGA domain-containing protein [Verrucomicrobiae bacterium]